MPQESGWQVSGDAPSFYTRYAYAMQEPWTEDLILQAQCKDGDRVLDVACGLVAGDGYIDDDGLVIPRENHFLMATR